MCRSVGYRSVKRIRELCQQMSCWSRDGARDFTSSSNGTRLNPSADTGTSSEGLRWYFVAESHKRHDMSTCLTSYYFQDPPAYRLSLYPV